MLEPGTTAPQFQLNTLNGTSLALKQVLAKGPALLAFYKISCPVCQLTFPFLERMAGNNAVQVVGVSQDDAKGTEEFNQRFGVHFPTLLDEAKKGYPVSNEFGISTVPTFFVVEADGSISKAFIGFSKRDLEELGQRMGVQPFRADEKVPEFKAG